MKTKLFFLNLIVIAAICTSCGGRDEEEEIEPTEKDLKTYISVLSHYYPYSINDNLIFKNENSGESWENKPFNYSGSSIYPETKIWLCDDPDASCYGDRTAQIAARFIENGVSQYDYDPSQISTFIAKSGSEEVYLSWNIMLSFGAYDYYRGSYSVICMPKEVLAQLTDTIIIPIRRQGTTTRVIDAPEGAYARIIKDYGLTDFSVDGETVWRRVME